MNKIELFKDLLNHNNNEFIGYGNPCSNILIIGKECAAETDDNVGNNYNQWKEDIKNNITQDRINGTWENQATQHPIFMFKGQLYKVYSCVTKRKGDSLREGEIIQRGIGGTSRTWHNYQRLIDMITMGDNYVERDPNAELDFQKYAFVTELSAIPARMSSLSNKEAREESLKGRCDIFFGYQFFQSFPIVVAAAGTYIDQFRNLINLERMFEVKWQQPVKKGWINVHYSTNPSNPKLLLHVKQLSMVSNKYIKDIAETIKEFIKNNNIQIK